MSSQSGWQRQKCQGFLLLQHADPGDVRSWWSARRKPEWARRLQPERNYAVRSLSVLLAVAVSAVLAAAPAQARDGHPYTLVDLGTLGGPQSAVGNIPIPFAASRGALVGTADTATADPYGSNENPLFNGDPFVQHTFVWRDGAITDLGALGLQPAINSSWPASVNARGELAGASDNGTVDPLTGAGRPLPRPDSRRAGRPPSRLARP
jgi:hypothetical protein